MNATKFRKLMMTVAQAWNEADAIKAVDCFTDDAVYMEPPDRHFFRGRDQLLVLFATLQPGNNMAWHHLWFDEESQVGAGEFTFGQNQTHGAAIMAIEREQIKLWREYQWHGRMLWEEFIGYENKTFEYTIEHYAGPIPGNV